MSRNDYEYRKYPLLSNESITNLAREIYAIEKIIIPVDTTTRIAQTNNNELRRIIDVDTNDSNFKVKLYGREAMIVKRGKDNYWRIFIPKVLRQESITWYHDQLIHPGAVRMQDSLHKVYTWPNMMNEINAYVATCDVCQ